MRASQRSPASTQTLTTHWQDSQGFGPGVAVSAVVHIGIVVLGLISWQNAPAFKPEDVIPVAIVADTPSAIGPESAAEAVRTGEETSELTVAETPLPDAAPRSEPVPTPSPAPASAQQAVTTPTPKSAPKAPPPPQPAKASTSAKPEPSPSKAALKTQAAQPAPSSAASARARTQPTPRPEPQFDFAAASAAASGADSGGRRAPQLATAGQSARQGRAGGGTQLAGDLESALRAQIYPCWQEPSDPSPRLIVSIQIELGPDGNLVREPKLMQPTSRAGADGRLLVAIDNAMRAVRQCAPFDLPADRFNQWRQVNFSFDKRKAARP